ncbi:MAG: aminotransferase class III-fold pyridoxal phosphate-dependent enzyme, partial [Acidimicrobiia bacterium]|nr:aminotransferase class III-fold pyridoxal phosphate-dependent enzyme [Acidimicrobiia bacterium]
MPTYGAPSIMFVKGEGSELWDVDGKRYIDWLAGIAVCSLGHAHPEVAAAITEQASK